MLVVHSWRWSFVAAVVALLSGVACGKVELPGGTGGVGGGTTSTGATTTTTTGSGSGLCGGIAGIPCADDEFCDFSDDRCGGNDSSGVCKKRPGACGKDLNPTCGCDGTNYGNACVANNAGVDVNNGGTCEDPVGMFHCGAHYCVVGSQYCELDGSDVGGTPDSFGCKPLPAGCGPMASCACLNSVQCGSMCSAAADGGLQVICPGG